MRGFLQWNDREIALSIEATLLRLHHLPIVSPSRDLGAERVTIPRVLIDRARAVRRAAASASGTLGA